MVTTDASGDASERTISVGHHYPGKGTDEDSEEPQNVRYAVRVGGTVEKATSPRRADPSDAIQGSTAVGIVVGNPADSWTISGPIETIEWATTHPEGELTLYVDGEEKDLSGFDSRELTGREFEDKYRSFDAPGGDDSETTDGVTQPDDSGDGPLSFVPALLPGVAGLSSEATTIIALLAALAVSVKVAR